MRLEDPIDDSQVKAPCALCLAPPPGGFVKSHVIPRAFFRNAGGTINALVSSDSEQRVVRNVTGIYGQFLCDRCERSFHAADDHFIAFARSLAAGEPMLGEGRRLARAFPSANAELILRYFLGVLFRADVCHHAFFKRVELGPLREIAREALAAPDARVPLHFDCILFADTSDFGGLIMDPFLEDWEGINAYRVYCPPLTAIVKVDRRPFHGAGRHVSLRGHSPVCVIDKHGPTRAERAMLASIVGRRESEIGQLFKYYGVDPRAEAERAQKDKGG